MVTHQQSPEAIEYIDKIVRIIEWSQSKPKFSTTFVESVLQNVKNYGNINGYGFCQNPLLGDYNIFNLSYKGEISTLNHRNFLMKQILNSNADLTTNLLINSNVFLTSNGGLSINNRTTLNSNGLTISNLTVNSNGAITYLGKPFLTEAGAFRMRTFADEASNQGFGISPNGFVSINGTDLQITNEGVASFRQTLTGSNIITSNLTVASNLTMPKDYKNGKIYKIEVDGEIYVGSTTLPYLCKRLYYHKKASSQSQRNGVKLYQKIREREHGWDDIEIVLLETFPCNSNDELRARERYWKDELKATLCKFDYTMNLFQF